MYIYTGFRGLLPSPSFPLLSGPELSDTKVYEPQMRALLGTTSHFCEEIVLESRTVPNHTTGESYPKAFRVEGVA